MNKLKLSLFLSIAPAFLIASPEEFNQQAVVPAQVTAFRGSTVSEAIMAAIQKGSPLQYWGDVHILHDQPIMAKRFGNELEVWIFTQSQSGTVNFAYYEPKSLHNDYWKVSSIHLDPGSLAIHQLGEQLKACEINLNATAQPLNLDTSQVSIDTNVSPSHSVVLMMSASELSDFLTLQMMKRDRVIEIRRTGFKSTSGHNWPILRRFPKSPSNFQIAHDHIKIQLYKRFEYLQLPRDPSAVYRISWFPNTTAENDVLLIEEPNEISRYLLSSLFRFDKFDLNRRSKLLESRPVVSQAILVESLGWVLLNELRVAGVALYLSNSLSRYVELSGDLRFAGPDGLVPQRVKVFLHNKLLGIFRDHREILWANDLIRIVARANTHHLNVQIEIVKRAA